MIPAALTVLILALTGRGAAPPTAHKLTPAARAFREQTYRLHPCIAAIVDREDPSWDPTVDYGGGHGNTSESYGLPQADPGTKLASAGPDWRTSRATQLRWAISYSARYGGECGAWAFWQAHSWW